MTTLPEEAVTAALGAYRETVGAGKKVGIVDALTAALPFLPVQGAVKKLKWRDHEHGSRCISDQRYDISIWIEGGKPLYVDNYTTMRRFGTLKAAKAAAQADYEARILSALEPSAARELALEEAAKIAFDISENGEYHGEASVDSTSSIYQQGAYEVYEALRSLSSPDQADAGKVEGDGWRPMTHPDLPLNGASVVMFDSFAPGKDGFGQVIARFDKTHGWHVSASVVGGKYIALTNPIKWRPLFSAPASEGAE